MIRLIYLVTLLFAMLDPGLSYADGVGTRICIENKSGKTYWVTGVNVENGDWQDVNNDGAMNRPDHNWVDERIAAGEVRCRAADYNDARNPKFDFSITDKNSPAVLTRMARICITYSGHACKKGHWKSYPPRVAGSLGARHQCLDPKMELYDVCDLFIINK